MDGLCTIILQLAAWSFLIQAGAAVKCYVCNSKQDPRCLNPFNGTDSVLDLVDCNEQEALTKQQIQNAAEVMRKLGQNVPVNSGNDRKPLNVTMACQKMVIDVLGEEVTGRGCSANRMESYDPCDAVKLVLRDGINLRACTLCESDGCNRGGRIGTTLQGLGALLLLVLIS